MTKHYGFKFWEPFQQKVVKSTSQKETFLHYTGIHQILWQCFKVNVWRLLFRFSYPQRSRWSWKLPNLKIILNAHTEIDNVPSCQIEKKSITLRPEITNAIKRSYSHCNWVLNFPREPKYASFLRCLDRETRPLSLIMLRCWCKILLNSFSWKRMLTSKWNQGYKNCVC